MTIRYSFSMLVFSHWLFSHPFLIVQAFSKTPRLCAHQTDPSQYYPCALNYIGLNSWSLNRCPERSTFDETSQQCLVKIPVSDTFDQLASISSVVDGQFQRMARFFVDKPSGKPRAHVQQPFESSTPPLPVETTTPVVLIKKRFDERVEPKTGTFWSHGYPLMQLDEQPTFQRKPYVNPRSNYASLEQPYPDPVSEDELRYKKICYFTNWAQYRAGPAKFEPEHIDPFLCTHIIYAFAYINNETYLISKVEENDDDLYRRINALKQRNPKLKTLLGVGGWNMMSHAFSTMVHDEEKRRKFIFDTINFLHKYNFDGFEADWEYPGIRGGQADDKFHFTLFFQEFREAAAVQSLITGRARLLIAAAVAANEDVVSNGYEIGKIAKVLDFINIMTYDFHGAWQHFTGLNAPLYRRYDEFDIDATLNQDFGIGIWLRHGAPAHKLVLGVPLFARTYLLAQADQNDLHAPTVGNGTEGPYTRSAGFLSYFEVCLLQQDDRWEKRSVPDGSESEYMFKDRDWISYDSIENVQKRAAYVVANNLGGIFVWSLDMDDFNGAFCNNGTYPYVRNSLALLPNEMPSYL